MLKINSGALKISKTRNVKTPIRGTSGSAGIDFFVPEDFETVSIMPGNSVFIPSGIKAKVPEAYALIAFNKSGVALKKSLQVGACVVDSDYEGEIHIHLVNVGTTPTTVQAGDKMVQFLLTPISHCGIDVVPEEELFAGSSSERGAGGFGSTGTR